MADEGGPVVWGLWNQDLGEWFNPGTRKPYFPTQEAARRFLPVVLRQYPMGKWEVHEYPLEEQAPDERPAVEPVHSASPPPGRERLDGVSPT